MSIKRCSFSNMYHTYSMLLDDVDNTYWFVDAFHMIIEGKSSYRISVRNYRDAGYSAEKDVNKDVYDLLVHSIEYDIDNVLIVLSKEFSDAGINVKVADVGN